MINRSGKLGSECRGISGNSDGLSLAHVDTESAHGEPIGPNGRRVVVGRVIGINPYGSDLRLPIRPYPEYSTKSVAK